MQAVERKSEAERDLARQKSDADFRLLMQEQWGRRIVWRLLNAARKDPIFSQNAMVMAASAALADYARRELLDRIDVLCPKEGLLMTSENR